MFMLFRMGPSHQLNSRHLPMPCLPFLPSSLWGFLLRLHADLTLLCLCREHTRLIPAISQLLNALLLPATSRLLIPASPSPLALIIHSPSEKGPIIICYLNNNVKCYFSQCSLCLPLWREPALTTTFSGRNYCKLISVKGTETLGNSLG